MLLLSIPLTIVSVLALQQYVGPQNLLSSLVVFMAWIIALMAVESVCSMWRRSTP